MVLGLNPEPGTLDPKPDLNLSFGCPVGSAGELGCRPVVPVLLGDGPDDVLVHSAVALSCSDSETAPSKP